jgi:hypothetical protein
VLSFEREHELGVTFDFVRNEKATHQAWLFLKAPLPGLISNQVYEGFAKLYELRAFLDIDGNKGIQAQC